MNKLLVIIGILCILATAVHAATSPVGTQTGDTSSHSSTNNNAVFSDAVNRPRASATNESSNSDTTLAPIPSHAIRLRIIANSDTPADQQLKREVRDAIIARVGQDLKGKPSLDAARAELRARVPAYERLAESVVRAKGYHYPVSTEYGNVPFPTKLYGNQVYPAGTYEALRIVIGSGSGQNWWCVLFPPLCFVDLASGAAVPNTADFPDTTALATITLPVANQPQRTEKVQVRSFFLDLGVQLVHEAETAIGDLLHHLFK